MAATLVTGGTGRLGRQVLAFLGDRGVAGVRRLGSATHHVELLAADPADLDPAQLAGFDAVINCAGIVNGTPDELEWANVSYPVALAERAREAGVPRFIQVSSFAVYGRNLERIDRGSALAPDSNYGKSKLKAELALELLGTPEFHVALVRLPFMFSAEEPALLGRLVRTILLLHVLPVRRGRTTTRSMLTYLEAARTLAALAANPDILPGPVAVADPKPLDLTDVARSIREILNRRIAIVPVPASMAAVIQLFAPAAADRLMRSNVLDPSANWLKEVRYPVAKELSIYLSRIKRHQ